MARRCHARIWLRFRRSTGRCALVVLLSLVVLVAASAAFGYVSAGGGVPGGHAAVRRLATNNGDPLPFNTATTVTVSNAGDVATLSFSGTAGQQISMVSTGMTMAAGDLTVLKPDSSQLAQTSWSFQSNLFLDSTQLPVTGSYTVRVTGGAFNHTGSFSLTLYSVSDVSGSLTAGTGASLSISTPGQNASYTFSGTAGRKVSYTSSGNTINFGSVTILKPDGSQLASTSWSFSGNSFIDQTTLPVDGTYTVKIDPGGASTGQATVTVWDVVDASGSLSLGSGASLSLATPGQNASYTFSGTAGRKVSVASSGNTINFGSVTILKPDGSQLASSSWSFSSQFFIDQTALPVSGTYTVTIDPGGASTGQATVTAYDVVDVTGPIAAGGSGVPFTIATPGQNARLSFTGTAGQPVRVAMSGVSIEAGRLSLLKPDGSTEATDTWSFHSGTSVSATLSTSGTYTVLVDANSANTGTATTALNPTAAFEPVEQSYGTADGSGAHARSASAILADPVNTLTGAFTHSATDLVEAATGLSFVFTRSYTSADGTVGRLGPGWTDNYAVSLAVQSNGDVRLHGDEGQQVYFGKQADGSFVGAAGTLSTLSTVSGGYKLVRHDQVTYLFDASGALQSELDRNGRGLTFTYNGSGRLTTIADSDGHAMTIAYNASNLVSSVSTPDSRTVSYGYTSGRLTSVTLPDPDGAGPLSAPVWTYAYGTDGRLWQMVDPDGHTEVTNLYDGTTGRVTQQTDADGKVTSFAWDAATQTATVTDPLNHVWKDVYQNNVLWKRIAPSGETTVFAHDVNLGATGVTAPDGTDTTAMSYQNGNLVSATAPSSLGSVQKTFAYDGQNNLTSVTDARNKVTAYGYDSAGNNTSVTLDGHQVFGATYNAQGQMLTSTDGNGDQTSYTYDANGNLASVTAPDPDGPGPLGPSKTTYTYDAMGHVLSKVDPLGNCSGCTAANYTTTYTYDANGNLLTETDPLGHTTAHTYDAAGNETSVTDPNGHTTSYSYDNANHVIQVTGADPDGTGPLEAPVTTYSYDNAGNRTSMIDPRGNCAGCTPSAHATTYTYDQNNRLASSTTPKGETTTYSYDSNGNLAATVDPRGNVTGANPDDYKTSYTYDAAGRLLTTTDPLGHVTTNHYDAVGNRDWVKDANLHQTSYSYDAAGRILTVTAPDGGLTSYGYDNNGNLTSRTDDNNHTTTYAYDHTNELTTTTGPGTSPPVTTYTYDLNGNLATKTDPNGNATPASGDGITSYTYDRANRLTSIDYSGATPDVTYAYDADGNRTGMTDGGSGSVSYSYDSLNRLTNVARASDTFSYRYDEANNITSRTYPDSTQTTYTYDDDNRLASATTGGAVTSYSYNPAGELMQTTLPTANGYTETRSYDRAGRLTEVDNHTGGSTLSDYTASLDSVGNPTQVDETGAISATQTFTYDANDRITSVCFQSGSCPGSSDPFIRWTYDRVGNRLTEARPAGTTTYTYNTLDELTSDGTNTYTYDTNGNETSNGSRTFTYDLANRVTTTTSGSTTTTYSYDGDGNRLQASTGSGASLKTNYVWDTNALGGLPQLAIERDGNNSLLRRYAYGNRRISMTSGGNTYYYHYDTLGSVVNLTSATGVTQWTYSYEPFGAIRDETQNAVGAPASMFKFEGEYQAPTGLYNLRARDEDPATGRFLSTDPVPVSAGAVAVSLYVYANDQPSVMVDPSGQTFRPANAAPRTAQLAATRVLEGLRPCDVGVVIVCPATDTTGDGDTTDGAGGVSAGTVTATGGLAAILAAILSKCVAKYDEHRCTSFLVTDEHHIVAQTAARAKPARDVLIDIYPDGVDLPRGVNNRHNLVDIPRFAHYFLHNFAYYDEVNRLVLGAFSKGRGGEARSSARVVGRLDAIAQALRFAFGGGVAA